MLTKSKKQPHAYKKSDSKKLLKIDSPFAMKEAYSSVRTNLLFTNKGEKCPTYIVTSPFPNDGKSINCVNLAISFAQMGKKTLIVDMDMRNPTIHKLFGLELERGLSEVLAGLEKTVYFKETEMENLTILTAGQIPPNPAELIASNNLDGILKLLREVYDYIFIDTPPIEVVSDAAILAKKVTGYILVIKNENTDIAAVRHAISMFEQVEGNVVGFLLNDMNPKNNSIYRNYKYNYKYSYKNYNYGSNASK